MNLSHQKEFCRETFADALSNDLRDEMIVRMTQTRRRQKHFVNFAKIICIGIAFGFLAVTVRQPHVQPLRNVATTLEQPPVANLKINTVPFNGIIHTAPISDRFLVHSRPTTVAIVHTDSAGYEPISDEQLFQALRGWSIALVKHNGISQIEMYPNR